MVPGRASYRARTRWRSGSSHCARQALDASCSVHVVARSCVALVRARHDKLGRAVRSSYFVSRGLGRAGFSLSVCFNRGLTPLSQLSRSGWQQVEQRGGAT